MNTENGIRIFGITIRIHVYSNIRFGRSCREMVPLSGHQTYPDTGTVHNQVEVRKVWSGISINYLELGSLYIVNCFFTTCN